MARRYLDQRADFVIPETGFLFELSREAVRPALLMSLLSVWVLVGLFSYLNRYTRRRYFNIWTAGLLFYALFLTISLQENESSGPLLLFIKNLAVGAAGAFLLWGAARFLSIRQTDRIFGLFLGFLAVWSYFSAYHFDEHLLTYAPVFAMLGAASGLTAGGFWRFGRQNGYTGATLLSYGFMAWGVVLAAYPFLQRNEELVSLTFFGLAVIQLFIGVSMIILVLQEARTAEELTRQEIERKKCETELLHLKISSTEERYRSLFDQASEAIIIADGKDLRLLELNETARRLLGVNAREAKECRLPAFCLLSRPGVEVPSDPGDWFQLVSRKRQFNLIRRDGGATPVEVDGAPIVFEGRKAYQFFFREMTERSRLEQQLRQAEKLSALGKMISGVAHELNNPLAVIKGYLELILARHELAPQTRADLEKVAAEGNRAAKLVSNFLSFAREQPMDRRAVSINDLVQAVLDLRAFDLRAAGAKVDMNLVDPAPEPELDPDKIQQVVLNLINNAIQAIAEPDRALHLSVRTGAEDGWARIIVEDNGPGIPEEVAPHIFEPFFTTKEVGKGTGLGLSIAHSILSDHRGRIHYEPSVLGGAKFVVEIPLSGSAEQGTVPEQPPMEIAKPAEGPPSSEILILDDERSLAEMLGEMLQLLGHRTAVCYSAFEALDLMNERRFDLVLSDFRMPGMDGREFYMELQRRFPGMSSRVIFLTGDVVNEETQNFLHSTGNRHLPKPFQLAAVEKAVGEVLTRRLPEDLEIDPIRSARETPFSKPGSEV